MSPDPSLLGWRFSGQQFVPEFRPEPDILRYSTALVSGCSGASQELRIKPGLKRKYSPTRNWSVLSYGSKIVCSDSYCRVFRFEVDAVPASFDCGMRKLAYQYGKKPRGTTSVVA